MANGKGATVPGPTDPRPGGTKQAPTLALDSFLPYRLSVLANTVSRSIAQLYADRFGMTIHEWRVMAVLGTYAPLSARAVAERTAMDKVQVSRAVARMLQSGIVDRRADQDDRRRSHLRLSAKGRRIYAQIVPLALAVEADLLGALSDSERTTLDRLLTKLQDKAALAVHA